MQIATPPERTLDIAVTEVRYGIEYASLNETFWRTADTWLTCCQAVAGAMALGGAFAHGTWLGAVGGGLVAAVSGLQLALRPSDRATAFRDTRKQFHDLNKRAWGMSVIELDAALEDLRAAAPCGSSLLHRIARNNLAGKLGRPDLQEPLTRRERLAAVLT